MKTSIACSILFALVVVDLSTSTCCVRAQRYDAGSFAETDYGLAADLTWNSANGTAPLPASSYPTLEAEAIYFSDSILRLRVQPKPGTYDKSKLEEPYIVPDQVFRYSSQRLPKRAGGKKAASPAYRVNITSGASRTYDGVSYERPTIVVLANTTTSSTSSSSSSSRTAPAATSQAWHPRHDTQFREIFSLASVEFQEQWVQFQTVTSPSSYITGFGERQYFYFLNEQLRNGEDKNVTLNSWGRDQGTPWRSNMYGQAPFFFVSDPQNSNFYGVFCSNSHAANLFMAKDAQGNFRVNMTFAAGILDLFIITGTDHHDVLRKFHKQVIGPGNAPPYWSLGNHQCRWGYHTLEIDKTVIRKYRESGIPLAAMWNDNDPNYGGALPEALFTINEKRFPMPAYSEWVRSLLAEEDIRYVTIMDPAIKLNQTYWVYQRVQEYKRKTGKSVFVTRAEGDDRDAVNTQWPGWSSFVDYTDEGARNWFNDIFNEWRANISVSGSWLDMAEISTFGCGLMGYSSCDATADTPWEINFFQNTNWSNLAYQCKIHCNNPANKWNYPPRNVLTNGADWHTLQANNTFLFTQTLSMSAMTTAGRYYSTKSFYGHLQAKMSYYNYRKMTGRRPFVLGRASYPGSGQYMAHWTGDNSASWHGGGLRASIDAVLLVSMMGMTQTGPDTGGFGGHPSAELLTRFYQATCFMTFTRNHNSGPYSSDPWPGGQEPFQYSLAAQVAIRDVILMRYKLLPYIFTELVRTHFDGGVVLRHCSTEFPYDKTYEETTTFMLGPSLLVAPITDEGVNATMVYLPETDNVWYDLFLGSGRVTSALRGGRHHIASSILYEQPAAVFLRGGSILPMHTQAALTIRDTRNSGISLLVALSSSGHHNNNGGAMAAQGEGFFDDGEDMLFADPDLIPDATSDNATAIRKVQYSCHVLPDGSRLYFEAVVALDGPRPVKMPLSAPATLTVVFPSQTVRFGGVTNALAAVPKQILLNSVDVTAHCAAAFVQGSNDLAVTMMVPDLTLDGTGAFKIEWIRDGVAPPVTATSPNTTSSTPAPSSPRSNSSSDGASAWRWRSETTGIFFAGIAVGVIAAVLVHFCIARMQNNKYNNNDNKNHAAADGGSFANDAAGGGGASLNRQPSSSSITPRSDQSRPLIEASV